MNSIVEQMYNGERPLYRQSEVLIKNCEFVEGESAIKQGRDITCEEDLFKSKYPFWHCEHVVISHCVLEETCRAAIWWSKDIKLSNTKVYGPKVFRDASDIVIIDSEMNTTEPLWTCSKVTIQNSQIKSEYLLAHSSDIIIDGLTLDGKYGLQYISKATISNSRINSKDFLWNSKNVTVRDSYIEGAYIGWYSENITFVNCTIKGSQPLYHAKNLILDNCTMIDTDLAFEFSEVQAQIIGSIDSVKNPVKGYIEADSIGDIIMDPLEVDISATTIKVRGE